MLIKTGNRQEKNPYWQEVGLTPNEAIEMDHSYLKLVTLFKQYNRIKSQSRFIEVRVSNRQTSLTSVGQLKWWDNPIIMDKVFWVFQSPHVDIIDGQAYSFYVFEPYECQWVINLGYSKYGRMPVNDVKAAFYIPVECCHHAWNETSAGYSDHLRPREKIAPTPEEQDRKNKQVQEGRKLLDQAVDCANDPRFERLHATLEKAVRNGAPTDSSRIGKL